MKKTLLIIFTSIIYQITQGQEIKLEFPSVVPPEISNFIKFGNIPVNESNGTAGISIPIYTIKQDGIEFPLNLTYYSGGNRVTDEATWVGLGWDISLGSIVQMVQGENDLEFPVYLPDYHSSALLSPMNESTAATGCQPLEEPYYGFYTFWDEYYPKNGSMEFWENRLFANYPISDLEPDIFIANFNGNSLQFLIDPDNTSNYILLNKKGYRVSRSTDDGWIITTSQGIKYFFDELNESTVSSFTNGSSSTTYSAAFPNADFASDIHAGVSGKITNSKTWQLTKIVSNIGKEINFIYSDKSLVNNQSKSYQWDLTRRVSLYSFNNGITQYGPIDYLVGSYSRSDNPIGQVSCSSSNISTETSYVSMIQFNDGHASLNFELTSRSDRSNAKKLQSITLKSGTSTIKTFNFNYNYFNSSYIGRGYVTSKPQAELTQRLKLESVSEAGKPAYYFIYNPTVLPPKNSFAQDYWGYYNGMIQNNSILPNIKRLRYSSGIHIDLPDYFLNTIEPNTTNNSADLTYAKASVLEEIIYPTGGSTKFDYELNTYSNQILPDKDYNEIHISDQVLVTSTNLSSDINQTRKGFTNPISSDVNCSCHVSLTSGISCNLNDIYARIYSLDISVKTEYQNDNAGFWVKYNANVYPKELIFERTLQLSQNNTVVESVNEDFNLSISPTKFYVAIVKCDPSCSGYPSNTANLHINIEASYLPPFSQTETKGNGLRIRTITNYKNTEIVNKKMYTYEGGKIPLPTVFHKELNLGDWSITENTIYSYSIKAFQFQSSNFIASNPLGAGNGVCYDKVTIEELNKQNVPKGRVEKYFTNIPDDFLASSPMTTMWGINLPSYRRGYDNGMLLEENVYDSDDKLVNKTEYVYLKKSYDEFYGARYKFLGVYHDPYTLEGPPLMGTHSKGMFSFYPIFKTETLLKKKTTTSKLNGQDVIVEEETNYTNDNLIRSQKLINSDGKVSGTEYFYPDDLSLIDELTGTEKTVISQLNRTNQHRIGEVIKSSTYTEQNTTKKVIRTYDNFAGHTLPASVRVSYQGTQFKNEAIFDNYDEKGNILQYHKENDINTFLVWAYNKQYPTVQIQTSDLAFDQTAIQTCTDGLTFSNNDDLTSINSDIVKLKSCLAPILDKQDYMVSFYTYKPLVGMTSQTDPSGKTSYYEYDAFGRLEQIKDQDGMVLKKYEYKYADSE